MVQLAAVFSAEPPPSPGFAALLNWRSAFRAFVDRRVRVVPLCVIVPHTAFTAAEFLPRDVAGWNEALPTVQTGQFIYHEAIPLACFFYLTTQGKVQDYLTLTDIKKGFGKISGLEPLPTRFWAAFPGIFRESGSFLLSAKCRISTGVFVGLAEHSLQAQIPAR